MTRAGERYRASCRSAENGFTRARRSAEHGFTLVEMMVALLIFGMLALAGVAILSFSVRAQSTTGAKLDDLSALTRTTSILSADLAQATGRQTRDEGGTLRPAFAGQESGTAQPMLQLVRQGWSNIDGAPRAGAQKVAYRLANGGLERIAYPMLDGAVPLPPALLVDHVRSVRLRYRYRGAWSDRWDGAGGIALPQAMEMTIERDDRSVFRTLFLVGTGYEPLPMPAPDAPGNASAPA